MAEVVSSAASPDLGSSEGAGLPDFSSYPEQLNNAVGSSDSPVINTVLTLLADWAIGAVLITVVGGLVATFL